MWKKYLTLLEKTFLNITNILLIVEPTKTVIVNSPLENLYDMEATWATPDESIRDLNFTSSKPTRLPLRAIVTTGNVMMAVSSKTR
jgi:hypothetical protein